MPFSRIMVHLIWGTKNRAPIITKELKPSLLSHIKQNSLRNEVVIDWLNCVEDHIHLLVSLGTEQSVAKVVQLIKGESSFWVNKEHLSTMRFEWQDEYIALSVSQSAVDKVRAYISNQEEHHKKKSFEEEYNAFLSVCSIDSERFGKRLNS